MIPYMVGKLAPNSSHFTRGFVKYVPGRPGRGYFRAVPSQNEDNYVTSLPLLVELVSSTLSPSVAIVPSSVSFLQRSYYCRSAGV